jgi:hypothetical protein
MGTKFYNKMPGYLKEMDNYEAHKEELKSLLYIMLLLIGGICIFGIDNATFSF